jgi:NAD+ synthetase
MTPVLQHPEKKLTLKDIEKRTKRLRGFDVNSYIEKKIEAINDFFIWAKLDSAVIGISGGIDSAIVFALLSKASKVEGSPLKKVLGINMPIYGVGTSNQIIGTKRSGLLTKFCTANVRFTTIDLSSVFNSYVDRSLDTKSTWAQGQLASIVRTPCLYYHAAILQAEGKKSIVVGTINRDEGSYIGFFGKASDAMVDLQPIADIHKSEVYAVAEVLGIPEEIINATPAGDVWDGRNDESMIGAPYWFLEMYLLLKEFDSDNRSFEYTMETPYMDIQKISQLLKDDEKEIFEKYAKNIEDLHDTNRHKYQVGKPSHFIDILNRHIRGGW